MTDLTAVAIDLAEAGRLPDPLIRTGIRRLLRQRLSQLSTRDPEQQARLEAEFARSLASQPVAVATDDANQQHYEVPTEYYDRVLGRHKKYSCCYWESPDATLEEAETAALLATCERARLEDGMDILELGCGWGSLSLWMARHYPRARVTALSNSATQKAWIDACAKREGLDNLTVITANMVDFSTDRHFDRILSVEMFEHMRNWPQLFRRIAGWLRPEGHFFMHVFCHRGTPYLFQTEGSDDWMGRYFFTGGMMPSDAMPRLLQQDLRLEDHWRWNGTHYGRTLEAWLARHDRQRDEVMAIFKQCYGEAARTWYHRWRLFYLAGAELFNYRNGSEWWVSHYLFSPREHRALDESR